ncbi:MAG: type II secretion system F family protein [Phycisphaerae bacterium]
MQLIGLILMGVFAAGMVVYSLMPSRGEKESAVERRVAGVAKEKDPASIRTRAKEAALSAVLERAAPLLSRPVMPKSDAEQHNLRAKLTNAGFRRESAPLIFLAAKMVLAIIAGAVTLSIEASIGDPLVHMLGRAAFAAGLGFMLPNLWLWWTIRKRSDAIRRGLPDSLDLMVVSVEAGLGLDAALQRVGDEMRHVYSQLSDEFQIATVETQMGVPRAEALTRMAERTAVQEMKALVAVVGQAERLGTSVSKALRNQADSLRTKRRQKAEERAQKTAVKLMLPLILFIFPAILIVLGGPAGIKLAQTMSNGGQLNP